MIGTALSIAMMLPAVYQMGAGIYQGIKENELGKTKDPGYQIPDSAKKSLGTMEGLASQRELAGQSLIEDKMQSTTASGVNALNESGVDSATLGAMVDLFTNEQYGMRDLGIAAENAWMANKNKLAGALTDYSVFEDKKFDIEKRKPYEEAMRASTMLKEGSMQNLMGGMTGMVGTGMDIQAMNKNEELMNFLYGQNPSTTVQSSLNGNNFTNLVSTLQSILNKSKISSYQLKGY